MSDLMSVERFWNEVVPECVSRFEWGSGLKKLEGKVKVQKTLKTVLKDLDEAEFDLFTAQLVIKASALGVVGVELTEIIGWFKELRV